MDRNDQDAIEQLFVKLREVEGRTGPRDPEAEALIRSRIASQPGAPYYLAQTVVVQEQALEQAQRRIEELESRPQGFLSGLFGGGNRQTQPGTYRQPQEDYRNMQPAQRGGPWGGGGGGFLAGAAQTAMGVAGGVVLGNMLANMFHGGSAHAAEGGGHHDGSDSQSDDSGGDDGDSGGGDFGGGD